MKIYTRTGDAGETSRPGGRRVRKTDPLVEAVGTIDELNACLGLCLQRARVEVVGEVADALQPLQAELLTMGAMLAAAGGPVPPAVSLDASSVTRMEKQIDSADEVLPELRQFILPGGTELASRLHFARTVCRRAERAVVAATDGGAEVPPAVLKYLNRLSDLLFTLARLANQSSGQEDEVWRH